MRDLYHSNPIADASFLFGGLARATNRASLLHKNCELVFTFQYICEENESYYERNYSNGEDEESGKVHFVENENQICRSPKSEERCKKD